MENQVGDTYMGCFFMAACDTCSTYRSSWRGSILAISGTGGFLQFDVGEVSSPSAVVWRIARTADMAIGDWLLVRFSRRYIRAPAIFDLDDAQGVTDVGAVVEAATF